MDDFKRSIEEIKSRKKAIKSVTTPTAVEDKDKPLTEKIPTKNSETQTEKIELIASFRTSNKRN